MSSVICFWETISHSYAGVMAPVWRGEVLQREAMGSLLFTHDQASLMKRRLADGDDGCPAFTEERS